MTPHRPAPGLLAVLAHMVLLICVTATVVAGIAAVGPSLSV